MAHGLSVAWTETTPGCSFNLYRNTSNTFPGGTPYQSGLSASPFADTNGTPGQQYFYWTTAVLAGVESGPSNGSAAVFPTTPDSPVITGVTQF